MCVESVEKSEFKEIFIELLANKWEWCICYGIKLTHTLGER